MLMDGKLNGTWTLIFQLHKHLIFGFQGKLAKLTSADTLDRNTQRIDYAMDTNTMDYIALKSG